MAWIHPLAVEHRRKLYTRQDAWRLAPPGTPEAKMPGWLDPSMTRVRWREAQEAEARVAFEAEVKAAQAEQDRLCTMFAEIEYEFAWRKLCRKYGFDPDQPRDELGRWTAVGEQSDTSDDANTDSLGLGAQQANIIPICLLSSRSISIDPHRNQSWRAEYVCADGFAFWKSGTGSYIPGLRVDPRR
jgi:hypothetical protein